MEEIKCPYCGNVQVNKSDKGKYVYHCPFCNGDFDLESHLSIENNNKDRYLKAAYTHIQNSNLGYALEMLNRLELEYPFDKEVQALRVMYNTALEKEQQRIQAENEVQAYLARKEAVINQISALEKDDNFWSSDNGTIDKSKLISAFNLLDKAEEYELECPSFRAKMWSLYNDTKNGRRRLPNTEFSDVHRFYNLFCRITDIWDLQIEHSQTKKELKAAQKEWSNKITKSVNAALFGGIAILIISIVNIIFTIKSPNYTSDKLSPYIIIGSIGLLIILCVILYTIIYNSKSNFWSIFMFSRKKQKEFEDEFLNDLSEIEEEINENKNSSENLRSEYGRLTFDKTIIWMREHKDLLNNSNDE
ncbi:hypothetical protein [Ruminococcus sp.]|uniref:hypothetical protein n=1 Tax=Ruminococcus sp. TaxID=41978 RepID=UPI0025D49C6B|nr:hypothetical protein [Ruminococcus sp.]